MSRNILLTLAFDGTAYHGWQLQQNADTVQARVNAALSSVLNEPVNVSGCSRTDTGVHAEMFCCNFHTEKAIPAEKLVPALNFYLPQDIAVYSAEEKEADFHARFSCKKKEYVYRICNTPQRDPFWRNRALLYRYPLDEELLAQEAQDFLGAHDFSAFCSSGSAVQNKVRTVEAVSVTREGNLLLFRVSADGFLYNMVRIMVGTLLAVSENKIERGSIPAILAGQNRLLAGATAPPQGLYLSKVFY